MNDNVSAKENYRIGIDVGGTKISGILLNPMGEILARTRFDLPSRDYPGMLKVLIDLVHGLEKEAGQPADRIGLAVPGPIDPGYTLHRLVNLPWLAGTDLVEDLRNAMGYPIKVANDADCFAYSEATDGAGAGADSVAGVIIGTGVGAGFVFNGRLHAGRHGLAGEWGHNPMPWPTADELPPPRCGCGRWGCIEAYLSGPALARASGMAPRDLAAAAKKGEELAGRALNAYADGLARALASLINIIDPEVIVLGGGLSNIDALYELVPSRIGEYTLHSELTTTICRPVHGDDSGVRGAAWL